MNKQAIEAFEKVQKNTSYTLLKETYKNSKTKFDAICDIHGKFSAFLKDFRKPYACPKCKPKKRPHNYIDENEAFNRLNKIDGFVYGKYNGYDEDMEILCIKHNKKFIKTPKAHIKHNGCDLCAKEKLKNSKKITHDENIKLFRSVHGDKYDYSKFENKGNDVLSTIICPIHGEFKKTPHAHKSGQGCQKCALNIKSLNERKEQFIDIHNDRYDYSKIELDGLYVNNIICRNHDEPYMFSQLIINHLQGKGCPKCGLNISKAEDEIAQYIESFGVTVIRRDKTVLRGKELDIYIPEYNLAIEYDGMIWHSRGTTFPNNLEGFDKNGHISKTNICEENGIQLLHIFENEWILNKEQWKSVIKNKLNKTDVKIYARDTEIKEIKATEASNFCEKNHLQGKNDSSLNYGLFYNNKLVSVMTFSKNRFNKKADYEMVRFCNLLNHNVVGGASKLLKYFREKNSGKVLSYANRRWSNGGLYRSLGFKEIGKTQVGFYFFNHKDITKLYSRQKFQKHKLKNINGFDFDENKTALQNMFDNGYRQIFDSGNFVFIL